MSDIGAYIAENLRLSFAAWGIGQRMASLGGVLIALVLALLAIKGIEATFTPSAINGVAVTLGAWFLFLVLVVTPYRMWLAQRRQIAAMTAEIQTAIIVPGQQALLERRRRQEIADGYRQLLERAHVLRDRPIASAEELAQLEVDIDAWRDEATKVIRVSDGHAQARHFTEAFIVNDLFYRPTGFNGNHVSKLQVLNEYRERLQRLHDSARDRLI
jgi:hypothetical protein